MPRRGLTMAIGDALRHFQVSKLTQNRCQVDSSVNHSQSKVVAKERLGLALKS